MNVSNNRNHLAVIQLKLLDFPVENIRKALSKLTGIEHGEIADRIGSTRQTVTLHIGGHRKNPEIQREIAKVLEIPVEEIFERKEKTA